MGNSCCEGRPNKAASTTGSSTLQRKQTLISSKLKRDRAHSFRRTTTAGTSAVTGRNLTRTSSHPTKAAPKPLQPVTSKEESTSPVEPVEPTSAPVKLQQDESAVRLEALGALREEDERLEDDLDLEYSLESGRDCSLTQQKQLLGLFEMDEELDGLASVSLLNGKDKFEVLVMAVSSKCLYLLSTSDYSEVKCKIYLRYLRLLGLNSDRTAVAVVYKRGSEGLEHVILSSTNFESLLKAIVSVYFDETGKILPAVTHPRISDTEEFISSLNGTVLSELSGTESLRTQRLFITHGLVGETKLLHAQCLKSIQGSERAVQLIVSDRALYTVSYSFILIDRVPLETVKAVKFEDDTHVSIVADEEHRFCIQGKQGHDLEVIITPYLRRSTI